MGQGDDLGSGRKETVIVLEPKMPLFVDVDIVDHDALALAQEVPGNDVGVVFHYRREHVIAGAEPGVTQTDREHVERLGRPAEKDNARRIWGAEEAGDPRPGLLSTVSGRLDAQLVDPTVGVRVDRE